MGQMMKNVPECICGDHAAVWTGLGSYEQSVMICDAKWNALQSLEDDDRLTIEECRDALLHNQKIKTFGPQAAMELVLKLGVFLAGNNVRRVK